MNRTFHRSILSVLLVLCILFQFQWSVRVGSASPSPQGGDLIPGYWERSALPEIGLATFYSSGTMDWVWNYRRSRGEVNDCPECVGAVALLRAGDIGRKVWLQPPGGELAGPFMVVDCARGEDVQPLVDRSWVVDVSFEVGQLWGMTRPLDGVVVWADPAEGNAPPQPGKAPPVYIDPSQVVVTAPTATPEPAGEAGKASLSGWPTRLPAPLGTAEVSAPRTATTAPGKTTLPRPIAGTPTITAPTATPGPAGAATALPVPAAEATEPPVAPLGRPGANLLSRPTVSVESLAAAARPTATPRPTRDPARPTPTPLLRPLSTPMPPTLSQDDASAVGRFWQAFLHLIGR
jgi:hypothetical protein